MDIKVLGLQVLETTFHQMVELFRLKLQIHHGSICGVMENMINLRRQLHILHLNRINTMLEQKNLHYQPFHIGDFGFGM